MAETFDVAILMGSRSDWDLMQHAAITLRELGVTHEARVLSAHRTPHALAEYVQSCEQAGTKIFIAGAGAAAHLAGAVAAHTTRPVLGVPLPGTDLRGFDALLATVQMPAGIPVATLAVGKAGAVNAALLATSILALRQPPLQDRLVQRRQQAAEKILSEKLTLA